MRVANFVRRATAVSLGLASGAVLAHPGHGTPPLLGFVEGLVHLLTEPDHLAMLALAVGTAVLVVRRLRAQRNERSRRTGRP